MSSRAAPSRASPNAPGTDLHALIVECAPDGLLVVDGRGIIRFANAEAGRIFGYPTEHLTGRGVDELVPDGLRHRHAAQREEFAGAPQRRPMGAGRELIGQRSDGTTLALDVALSPVVMDGTPHVIAAVRDVSVPRRLVAEAAAAERDTRIRRQDEAMASLAEPGSTAATSLSYGVTPLREASAEAFAGFVRAYEALLERALEQRAFRMEDSVSPALRAMVEQLGFLGARPRDLVEIHGDALRGRSRGASPLKASAYEEEARLMLLELMGYLASHYRKHALGARRARPTSG